MNSDRKAIRDELGPLAGVLPVVQLPFNNDESIDFTTLAREIDWLLEHGANGVTMAMVTEILRLNHGERQQVAQAICRNVGGRGHAIISVGADSTYTATELSRHAEANGATAVMAIPPISVQPLDDELLRYFAGIINSVQLPVIVQDASGYVGRPLGIATMARLLNEFGPERIMFKPEAAPLGPQLSKLRDLTRGQALVFEGSGGITLVDNYRRGIAGTMPGADLIQAIITLWKALVGCNDAVAYRVSLPLSALVALQIGLDGFIAIEKYLLVKQGVFRNTVVRGPVGYQLDGETREEVDRLFELLRAAIAVS